MLADPAVIYAETAQRRCREIAEEIVEILHSDEDPRITGALLESYHVVDAPPGAEIVSGVKYWKFVEFGTRRSKEVPHVRPAIEIVRGRHT